MHDHVHELLVAHVPGDRKEESDRAAMLDFLAALPEPFSREQPLAHFTASALVLDEARRRTALVRHRKLGLWLQPGGHVDSADATIEAAALREVREETGLAAALDRPVHLDIHEIPAREDAAAHLHLDIRFLVVAAGEELELSDESTDVRWWRLDEAATAGDESLARLLRAAGVESP